eukprot:10247551-Alexandrium_andersonii.AAC.1
MEFWQGRRLTSQQFGQDVIFAACPWPRSPGGRPAPLKRGPSQPSRGRLQRAPCSGREGSDRAPGGRPAPSQERPFAAPPGTPPTGAALRAREL